MTTSKDIGAGIKRKEPSGRISHKLQAAEAELEELHFQFLAAQRVAKVFKDKLQLAQRLNDAKMRRVDAAQAKKPRGSAVLQLERLYQAEEQLLRAQLADSQTSHYTTDKPGFFFGVRAHGGPVPATAEPQQNILGKKLR